jgi:hypothetical protein
MRPGHGFALDPGRRIGQLRHMISCTYRCFTFADHGDYIHQNDNLMDLDGLTMREILWMLHRAYREARRSRHPGKRANAWRVKDAIDDTYRKYFRTT